MTNNLHEDFQSAYKVHHSTETVMVKVQDDIARAIDFLNFPLVRSRDRESREAANASREAARKKNLWLPWT